MFILMANGDQTRESFVLLNGSLYFFLGIESVAHWSPARCLAM